MAMHRLQVGLDLKKRKEFALPLASLESRVHQLGEMIQSHRELAERSTESLEQTMREHAVQVEKSLQAMKKGYGTGKGS